MGRLEENHPLNRPIEEGELRFSIQRLSNNKAPGPSRIKAVQLKNLPPNIVQGIKETFDAMLASMYMPEILLKIRMVFQHKMGSDPMDPLNYRPISLD